MPKVPERPLSKGEILDKNRPRQTHGKPLNIRKLTGKRRVWDKRMEKNIDAENFKDS